MRAFGLDVHRDFCEVAIAEDGEVRSAGRVATRVEALELFAESLAATDVVALEATTGADKIVSLLQAHGVRVVVANTRKLRSISDAKAKTDRLDAQDAGAAAGGGAARPGVDAGRADADAAAADEPPRAAGARADAREERGARRAGTQPLRAAAGHRRVRAGRSPLAGRRLELPVDERLTLDGCLRQVDFLDGEIVALDARDRRSRRSPGPRCCG